MGKRLDRMAVNIGSDPAARIADRSQDTLEAIHAELVSLNQRLDWLCRTVDAHASHVDTSHHR